MKITILTGAGISAESGLKTFRDSGGLWENYDVMEVASIQGWHKNQSLVLDFYNQRRKQLLDVSPNAAHLSLAELEDIHDVCIITQNVDDLHERAGSQNIIHLHGELNKVRSVKSDHLIYEWKKDLKLGDVGEDGHQLRPHIVWFGEAVPMLDLAVPHVMYADKLIIIGTSMQVYPAAGLCGYAKSECEIFYCDLDPQPNYELNGHNNLQILKGPATEQVPMLIEKIKKEES